MVRNELTSTSIKTTDSSSATFHVDVIGHRWAVQSQQTVVLIGRFILWQQLVFKLPLQQTNYLIKVNKNLIFKNIASLFVILFRLNFLKLNKM